MLDALTLRVAFAVTSLTLLLLFALVTYRHTGTRYSLWWSAALALFLTGSAAYLLDGSPQQIWANPTGNGLLVLGAACVWAGARSLRVGSPGPLALVAAPLVTVIVSAFDDPAVNTWSGGPVFLGSMALMIGLSSWELYLLDADYSRVRWPLCVASGGLALFYVGRLAAFVAVGPEGAAFRTYFGTEVTTLVTMVLLVIVSFSMAGLSGEQLTRDLSARATRSGRELARGGQVQQNLLPHTAPDVSGYDVAGVCIPSGEVSGDFFDWQLTPGGLAVTVADVMGKGVGAAMIAATIRAALRVALPGAQAAETLARVDEVIETDLASNDAFVTLFHGRLEPDTGRLSIVDAGHGLAVVVRADGEHEILRSANLPLGVLPGQDWVTTERALAVGDLLLVFSDGVLDLFDGTLDALSRASGIAAEALPTARDAVDAIAARARELRLTDDVTVVAIRRTG